MMDICRKKALIFDMDGVLVDSETCYLNLIREFLKMNGKEPDEQELLRLVGADERESLAYICTFWKEEKSGEQIKLLLADYFSEHRPSYKELLFEETVEVIKELSYRKYILALASSSSMEAIEEMLEDTGLKSYFSILVSGEIFPKSKPDPEIYRYTMKKLGLRKKECLIIEDSEYGIAAGKAAGVEVAAVDRQIFAVNQSKADFKMKSLKELIKTEN